jgi:hypothetical protein
VPANDEGPLSGMPGGVRQGSRIAGYLLEEQIGRGGMAVIFRATDEQLGRQVAVKILEPSLAANETFRQRFIMESRTAAAVDHPHIIPVFEAREAAGVLFIAMRYVPSGDVGSLLHRDGPLSASRVASIISPVASALDAAHAAGLVHRDVKPSNMLLDLHPGRPDHVYLSDFGLTKTALAQRGLTAVGQFVGTVEYTSPEQVMGLPPDGRADQYSLACAAFELLTGTAVFPRENPNDTARAHLSEPPPAVTTARPDLPTALDPVLARAMAKAPADRYASCSEFADAVRTALRLAPYVSGPQDIPPEDPPGRQPTQLADLATGGPAAATELGNLHERATVGAGGPGPGDDDVMVPVPPPRAPFWRRPRTLAAMAGTAAVVVAGVITAALLSGSHPPAPKPPARPIADLSISATTKFAPIGSYVYVGFQDGAYATARISGLLTRLIPGQVAVLYAQPFPFRQAPAPVGTIVLPQDDAPDGFAFTVRPSVATRYTVKVFADSTEKQLTGRSQATTVYVSVIFTQTYKNKCSTNTSVPVCHTYYHYRIQAPAQALQVELSKQLYAYFGIRLSPTTQPPAPKVLTLGAGDVRVGTPRQISATEFTVDITYTVRTSEGATWDANVCLKDTEQADGVGLPGSHGCGARRIPKSVFLHGYLG